MNIRTVIRCAAFAAAFSMSNSTMAQSSVKDLADMASAAMDAARERGDQATAPEAVKAVFAKADEMAEDGGINFCGFYPGMTADDAKTLSSYYKLKDGELTILTVPETKDVYKLQFSLKGVRRITKGGNSFEDLSQAVANRVGTMNAKHNDDYDLIGYEYKNIDGQRAFMSENNGFLLEDGNLSRKAAALNAEAERKAATERAEAARKAEAERAEAARKRLVEQLPGNMVRIPDKN